MTSVEGPPSFDEVRFAQPVTDRLVRQGLERLARLNARLSLKFLGWAMFVGIGATAVAEVQRGWFSLALVVVTLLLGIKAPTPSAEWANRLMYGGPRFGRYGGVPKHALAAEIECAADLHVTLPDPDAQALTAFGVADAAFVRAYTKNEYFRQDSKSPDDWDWQEKFDRNWEEAVTEPVPRARSTYRDAVEQHPLAFEVATMLLLKTRLFAQLPLLPLAVIAFVSPLLVVGDWSWLPAILATSVLLGLVGACIAVAISSGTFRPGGRIPISRSGFDELLATFTHLSEPERADLRALADAIPNRDARIMDFRGGPAFKTAIARFLGRQFLFVLGIELVSLLALIVVCLAVAAPLADAPSQLAARYGQQAALLGVTVAAMVIAYPVWGFVINRLGSIAGPPIGAAIAAATIPVAQYFTTESLDFDWRTTLATAGVGAAGLFGTSIGESMKRSERRAPGAQAST